MRPEPPHGEPLLASVNGIDIAYDTFGNPRSQPLLLIMGLGAQMIAWDDAFCGQLADRGYHVIRFDNRDIGLSTKLAGAGVPDVVSMMAQLQRGQLPSAPYTLADMAEDGFHLLDALGIDDAHVVGASMGGAIAQEMALRRPRRVRTLTSIMSTSGDPGLPPPTREAMAMLSMPTPTERSAYVERYRALMRVLRGAGFAEDEARDHERAERAFSRGIHPEGVARQFAAILASGSRKDRLASLRVPTLVIHGSTDPLVPLACGLDVARTVPGARLMTIERMGHALPIQAWPAIVEAIAGHAISSPLTGEA